MTEMQQMQMVLPSPKKLFTPGVTGLLIASIAGFLLLVFVPQFAWNVLGVSATGLRRGMLWQVVTYAFVQGSPMTLVFNCMVILFVGSTIEREWRTASFLTLWFVVSVVCGLLWAGVTLIAGINAIGIGAAACSYGFISTMGLLQRGTRFYFFFTTLEAQHLALILIGVGILLNIMTPITLVWVAGALVAYVYVKARWSHMRKGTIHSRPRRTEQRGSFVDID